MNLEPRSSTQLIQLSEKAPSGQTRQKQELHGGWKTGLSNRQRTEKKKQEILNTTFKTSGTQLRDSTHKSATSEGTLIQTKDRENQLSETIKKKNSANLGRDTRHQCIRGI